VGGNFGVPGKPFTWDNSQAIQYRVDGGGLGKLSHTDAVQMVDAAFAAWSSVPTAALYFTNAGPIPATGAFTDGDVSTPEELDAVLGACKNSSAPTHVNAIIFDKDGSLMSSLGADDSVLGIEGTCLMRADGHYVSAFEIFNGGAYSGKTTDLSPDEMSAVMEHEFGHFLGLDHSQVNMACLTNMNCTSSQIQVEINDLPTMFPFIFSGQGGFQKSLSEDDQAWISYLYPVTTTSGGKTLFSSVYGVISGSVLFSDGASAVQGVNVSARKFVNGLPDHMNTYSAVSGFLFTGNPGQTVTGAVSKLTGQPGSDLGSRDPQLRGQFDIPVRAGSSYMLNVAGINSVFVGGSSIGPLGKSSPQGRGIQIPLPGTAPEVGPISVSAGARSENNNIQLISTPDQFDRYESQ
jgi:hypothetical protein